MTTLSTAEAAQRLGVKPATLYAYVSRGLLEAHRQPDRTSRFDTRQIEALARRGRPRLSSAESSIHLLIETRLTDIADDGVRYRGHPTAVLAERHAFEEVAELLWTGTLAARPRPWPRGTPITLDPASGIGHALRSVAVRAAALPRASATARVASATAPVDIDAATGAPPASACGRALIADAVAALCSPTGTSGATTSRRTAALHVDGRVLHDTIAGRLAGALRGPTTPLGGRATAYVATVNAALVLLADHDLAASTLAVRVAASTRCSGPSAVLAGLGALDGPLHGGASRLVRTLLEDAQQQGATEAVRRRLRRRERIPGFGHSVYTGPDPRGTALLRFLRAYVPESRTLVLTDELITVVAERVGVFPNIDLLLAAFERAAGLRPDSAEALFSVARIAGWLAHADEERQEAPLRFRPRARYVGPSAPSPGAVTAAPRRRASR